MDLDDPFLGLNEDLQRVIVRMERSLHTVVKTGEGDPVRDETFDGETA
jgi:hypothetical protein